jgi:hypothetical protein
MDNNSKDSFWMTIGKMLLSFLIDKTQEETVIPISIPIPEENPQNGPEIDWTKATSMITEHFSVGEAIALHSWNRLANENDGLTDEIKAKIIKTCQMMEKIRAILGCPLNIHCMFRSQQYNKEVVGAIPNDVHARGEAADWDANQHYTIDQAKSKIRPFLDQLNIRMEGATTTWIHNDWHAVGPSGREFKA